MTTKLSKELLIISCVFSVGCSKVNFSLSSSHSETKGPEIVDPTEVPTEVPVEKITVSYPYRFQLINYPWLGTAQKFETVRSTNDCKLMVTSSLLEIGLCEADPALTDFCSTTLLKTLTVSTDYTCIQANKAQIIRSQRGNSCPSQTRTLSQVDIDDLNDLEKYEILPNEQTETLTTAPGEAPPVSKLTSISINDQCQCFYEDPLDLALKLQWPALPNHCKKYFQEYL